jgi:hypothetical protein
VGFDNVLYDVQTDALAGAMQLRRFTAPFEQRFEQFTKHVSSVIFTIAGIKDNLA